MNTNKNQTIQLVPAKYANNTKSQILISRPSACFADDRFVFIRG